MHRFFCGVLGILLVLLLAACSGVHTPQRISEIACGSGYAGEAVVYIQEGDTFEPFLVADGNYNGQTLLVRQELLPISRSIDAHSARYENSEIDQYLNETYCRLLHVEPAYMALSSIAVTEETALGCSGRRCKTIERTVFLLSLAEVGGDTSVNAAEEGKIAACFQEAESRIACRGETAASWWLRTPDTYYLSCAYGIGADGKIGVGNAWDENGIRPAFCVLSNTPIVPNADLVEGKTVYTLSHGD